MFGQLGADFYNGLPGGGILIFRLGQYNTFAIVLLVFNFRFKFFNLCRDRIISVLFDHVVTGKFVIELGQFFA